MESIYCKKETQNQIKHLEYEKFFRDKGCTKMLATFFQS